MTNQSWPAVDVIVPVLDEAATITGKLANLVQLDYPSDRLRVLVVDGWSRDGTADLAAEWSRENGTPVEVVRSGAVGKPAQIVAGLARCTAQWVLISDADARLPPSTLKSAMRLMQADASVALVGTSVRPVGAHPVDEAHWAITNWLRRAERRLGSAGLVVGPCYLARRDLLTTFGRHTISDDVHVSCRALLAGARIELAPETVLELRTPVGSIELLRHKTRKALGYVREIVLSLPHARLRGRAPTLVFFGRAALLMVLPALVLGAIGAGAAYFGWASTAAAAGAPAALLVTLGTVGRQSRLARLGAFVAAPLVTSLVLTMAVLLCPFVRQTPRYPKVSLAVWPPADGGIP